MEHIRKTVEVEGTPFVLELVINGGKPWVHITPQSNDSDPDVVAAVLDFSAIQLNEKTSDIRAYRRQHFRSLKGGPDSQTKEIYVTSPEIEDADMLLTAVKFFLHRVKTYDGFKTMLIENIVAPIRTVYSDKIYVKPWENYKHPVSLRDIDQKIDEALKDSLAIKDSETGLDLLQADAKKRAESLIEKCTKDKQLSDVIKKRVKYYKRLVESWDTISTEEKQDWLEVAIIGVKDTLLKLAPELGDMQNTPILKAFTTSLARLLDNTLTQNIEPLQGQSRA